MDQVKLRERVVGALRHVAPELLAEELNFNESLQDQLDLDSIDMINYLKRLQDDLKVEVPGSDYGQFKTITGAVHYLESRC